MQLAAKKLIFNFEKTKNFAQSIGAGNMEAQFEPLSDHDEMGKALIQMKNDLHSYRSEMEQKVSAQTEEILHQKNASDEQRQKIEILYSDLRSSIEYAKRLQDSILPDSKLIHEICPEHFVLFLPKDVVSGDFYWFQKQAGKKLFAAADCTGHGVPGAFMSLVAHNALNHVTKVYTKPGQILNQVNRMASKAFNQDRQDQIRDGMDIALCSLDENTLHLEFSGAQNNLWIVREGVCFELKGDKQSVGKSDQDASPFTSQQFTCQKGDILYLFSDGYADQFGGEQGKKLMRKRFKEIIIETASQPMADQKKYLQQFIEDWRQDREQVDDILVMGIQV
jgi:serine phosphatase RsbU (regulator of sigma subunit)